ncbi:hypothetical protein HMPREF1529_02454 [Microbacterium sp. oral taxon 186 str. F0373]|jgi:hypothetical protein|nr:hypothetical protein OR221_1721 [Microbacterium laevaniformans OR221]EPD83086.1 hypothetical protein HMPREF1529_02454 [Microbacterium sp. oral taxon 186 str. F0373]
MILLNATGTIATAMPAYPFRERTGTVSFDAVRGVC